MTTVLDEQARSAVGTPTAPGTDAPHIATQRASAPGGSTGSEPSERPSRFPVVAVFLVLMGAFAAHLAAFGSWLIDDAGISMAYAVNLAHGHGLVAQPGAAPVEAFSDPLWVALLAGASRIGLLGSHDVLGIPGYVLVVKGLAVGFHAVVLGCLLVVIRRVLAVVRGRPAGPGLVLTCWAAAGLLLAANPSYVIWMGSGLENPLYAAIVAGLAALATSSLPTPDRRAAVGLGLLAAAAALTRPDGVVYAGVIVAVAALAGVPSIRERIRLAAWGLGAFAAPFGAYLAFRRVTFDAWVPNTAVAKDQGLPGRDVFDGLDPLVRAFGLTLTAVAVIGVTVALVRLARARSGAALRVCAGGLAPAVLGIGAYLVLPTDWMAELRFLTPVWPLLSVAAVLGAVQLVALAGSPLVRVGLAVVLVVLGAAVVPSWRARSDRFQDQPTLPLCYVAARYGAAFDAAAAVLGRSPADTTVVLPDIGGVLLGADIRVVDLAGLADPVIARLLADGTPAAVADHLLGTVRPEILHIHGDWVARSGLLADPRFAADYVPIDGAEDWVRRDVVAGTPDPTATLERLRTAVAAVDAPVDLAACPGPLFG